jgi:hypothetical protein
MQKKFLFILFCSALSLNTACGSAGETNTDANANTANKAVNQTLPPGFSTSPLPTAGTTPGIPDPKNVNMNSVPKGTTPTPGIPSQEELKKPFKPGATPTPGIPDEETLKKQMQPINANSNQAGQPASAPQASDEKTDKVKTVRKQ